MPPYPEQSMYVCAPEFLERKYPVHSTLIPSVFVNGDNGMPFKAMNEDFQLYFKDVSTPVSTEVPAQNVLLNNFHCKKLLSITLAVILYRPDAVNDNENVWVLPDKETGYELNSPVCIDELEFDINAIVSLKEFKLIAIEYSSLMKTVTAVTTPAVNVEMDTTEENFDDGMFELVAVISLVPLRSVLGP